MEPASSSNSNISQLQLTRLAIVFAIAAVYALYLGPAYSATEVIAASLSVIPISVAGWLRVGAEPAVLPVDGWQYHRRQLTRNRFDLHRPTANQGRRSLVGTGRGRSSALK